MSKRTHIGWHDIELYVTEKVAKNILLEKKDHFVEEMLETKNDLLNYKKDPQVYKVEQELYIYRLMKNAQVLEGLKLIFPEDNNLKKIVEDLRNLSRK